MSLQVQVVGEVGSGKSTVARIVTMALIDAGFCVELDDPDDMTDARFARCKNSLKGTKVKISCVQTKMVGKRD